MSSSPFIIGLTGGIGSGKSAAARIFKELGIEVIDADDVARDVVAIGSKTLKTIAEHFNQQVLLPDGSLNRSFLRQIVFQNQAERRWLENLLHPLIRKILLEKMSSIQSPYGVVVVPLLFEGGFDALVARTLAVDVDENVQFSRLMTRDKLDEFSAKAMLQSQLSREERLDRAIDVINNNGSLEELQQIIEKLHVRYLELCKKHDKIEKK